MAKDMKKPLFLNCFFVIEKMPKAKMGRPKNPKINFVILSKNIQRKKAGLKRILPSLKSQLLCGIPSGYCCIHSLQKISGARERIKNNHNCHFFKKLNLNLSKIKQNSGNVKNKAQGFKRKAEAVNIVAKINCEVMIESRRFTASAFLLKPYA